MSIPSLILVVKSVVLSRSSGAADELRKEPSVSLNYCPLIRQREDLTGRRDRRFFRHGQRLCVRTHCVESGRDTLGPDRQHADRRP